MQACSDCVPLCSCLVTGDSYRTLFHAVPARTSPHLQRLEVQAQQSSKDPAFWRQVYFHCMAVVCDPNLEDTCNKTCVPGEKRSARSVDRYSQIRGYASAGPVQLVPEGGVVDLKTAVSDSSPLSLFVPVLGVVAALLGVLLTFLVALAVRSRRC
ncbi:hypothetical protein AOXY_G28898 [Acipenser oxyrinchus oxyrinchus]|uniref:ZP domain-containing protein n=1 Tax=Acipenser oxyrinchus oxyrinchus TaxID=40147 RepID=A0AAD8CNG4_ACIOX|nr:hypothetical protein AOXY_G28898 [Acipenser oxyrinchus oxyrinchus]